jgi:putative transposase
VRFRFIEAEKANYPVAALCRNLRVTRSGFYAWRERPLSRRDLTNGAALVHIRAIYRRHRQNYGSPRVLRDLRDEGIKMGRHRVARLMRGDGLRAKTARKFRLTTNSRHSHPVAENLLGRRFNRDRPNEAWVADITYVWTDEGWLYLNCILDLYGRRVVGDRFSEDVAGRGRVEALAHSPAPVRHPPPGLIHHSDRGVQYACDDHLRILRQHSIRSSMSRKGNCWDNAPMESFFGTLKREIGETRWPTRSAAAHAITAYIAYYNQERRHSALHYRSPIQYEMKKVA